MVKDMPKQKLKVRGLLHTTSLSESEVDFIVGTSTLLDLPVLPRFRVISPGGGAEYAHPTLGAMLRAVVRDMACRPLNMVETMTALNAKLGPVRYVELKLIGPTAQLPLVLQSLEAAGRNVTTRSVLEQQSSAQSGRIAVVGMAGRFPGCDDIEGYWEIISNGRAVHKEVRVPFILHLVTCDGPSVSAPNMSASQIPPDRFDLADFFHPTHKGKNTAAVKHGCFIDKPGLFDARFFNISPREALQMEPTHRLFLMVTYEALEMAGYSQSRTKATDPSRIGVFFGQSTDDWQDIAHNRGSETFSLTGQQRALGPARVSYHFKWDGPSYSVDSACASSLSTIHLACSGLLARDFDMAVAGGANIMASPFPFSALSKAGVLSTTGGCKTFRDDADGYCRGDFVGSVVLKRLEDAVAANDNILGVIASSSRNHSGHATSITHSDHHAQAQLFQQVLRKACVDASDVSYIEMHGTATQVGDLAEMTAVANTFGRHRKSGPLRVGAVKANIGHSEAVSA
jgi:zearalenone synthase (nonreducing iterative type I polyketide synthase)